MALNLPALHRWHRRIALASAPLALAWALSGFIHPILSSLQPRPATQAPPQVQVSVQEGDRPLSTVLQAAGVPAFLNARVIGLNGTAVYLVDLPGQGERAGFQTRNGLALPGADASHAVALARHYLGDAKSPLRSVTRLDGFTADYPYVNRILPAYRVVLDRPDRVTAYVETRTDRLLALGTPWRTRLMSAFRLLHSWHGAEGLPLIRTSLMTAGLALAVLAGLSGLLLYGFLWQRIQSPGVSRWHRRLGLVTGLVTLSLAGSGFWHLLRNNHRSQVEAAITAPATLLAPTELGTEEQPPRFSAVARTASGLRYRLVPSRMAKEAADPHAHHNSAVASASAGPLAHWVNAGDGSHVPDGEAQRAIELACAYSGYTPDQVTGTTPITQFSGEYGFVHKRLPVIRVAFRAPEGDRLYVEPATGALAAWIRNADATEGWVFSAFHKADWMTPYIGKDPRNALLSFLALLQVTVLSLGLTLWLIRRKKPRH